MCAGPIFRGADALEDGAGSRGAVDEFQSQVRSDRQQVGNLLGVRREATYRLGVAGPVAHDVLGKDVHPA